MTARPSTPYRLASLLLCAWLLGGSTPLVGQPPGGDDDPFELLLFAPDLILNHQGEIGLSEQQRQEIVGELSQAQADFVALQAELGARGESLRLALEPTSVDEGTALAIAGEIMDLETRIKTRHLSLAIRLKNLLSAEQQHRLAAIRDSAR